MFNPHIPRSGVFAGNNRNPRANTLLKCQIQTAGNTFDGPALAQRREFPLQPLFNQSRLPPVAWTRTHLLVASSMILITDYGFAVSLVEIHGRSQHVVLNFIDPWLDSGRTTRRCDERHSILNMREYRIDRLARSGVGQSRRTGRVRPCWARRRRV